MLQRAASNAYSWWWASHIRTKQGKWLEQSLQDMEDRVKHILQIIEEDADSFAKRAEMYYKKRPELINFVEESYRAYRALAERYEKISGELQNANHTIASVCPEQVEFAMEDDGDDDQDQPPRPPSSDDDQENPPKPPLPDPSKIPKPLPEHLKFNFKGNALRKHPKHALPPKSKKPQSTTSSQKNSKEAQERIGKLQKDILVLQTEKEFVTSSYESAMEKCWEIEKQITEMQEEICSLQDEFSVETVIEDNEARALMTAMALKSCKDTLVQLRDKQKKFVGEAKVASKKVRDAEEMLKALKEGRSPQDQTEKMQLSDSSIENFDEEFSSLNQEGLVLQSICEKIKEYFEANSNTARIVTELAESVDELVTQVLGLETALSSQTALVERLRLEADELHNHLKSLEEDKAALTKNSKDKSRKIKELEGELHRVKGLNQSVEARNVELRMSLMEACHNFGDLFKKIQSPKQKDEVEAMDASGANEGALLEEGFLQGGLHKEQMEEEEEELPDLQQLLSDGLEDKEKVILKEYTSILRNYKETKKRLSEMEKKNKETVAMKDAEIESLKHKLGDHQGGSDGESDTHLKEPKDSTENESKSSENDATITGHKQQKALEELLYERHSDYYAPKLDESSISILEEDIKVAVEEEHALSTVEEKFRKDLDELVEENLQFWLKFTPSYHQTQIFQKILKELQSEVQRLRKDSKKHDGNANASNPLDTKAEAISKRLKELRIDLFRWLEQNVRLKEELRRRLSLLCNMQEDISRVSKTTSESKQAEISPLQAAKFLGEIRNMQQENNKVADELQAGLNHMRRLQMDAEKLSKRRGIIEVSGAKSHRYHHVRYSTSRSKIPLRSFIFGVKTKKSASVSSTMPQNANTSLHQQRSSG